MKSKRAAAKTHTRSFTSKAKPKVKPKTKVKAVTSKKSQSKKAPPKKSAVHETKGSPNPDALEKSRLALRLFIQLMDEKKSLEERLAAIDFTPSETSGDTADMSAALAEEKMKVLEQDRLRNKIEVVNMVVKRIETNKNFAKCDDCGDEIELKRLLFMPTARRCVFCQEKAESR